MLKRLIPFLFPFIATFCHAQWYRLDVDTQQPQEEHVIPATYEGNTPFIQVGFYNDQVDAALSNDWTMTFWYSKDSSTATGTQIPGTWAGSNVCDFIGETNVFFRASKYYFSVAGIHLSGYVKTFGKGVMYQDYDPATDTNLQSEIARINVTWWTNNLGLQVFENKSDIADLQAGLGSNSVSIAFLQFQITSNDTDIAVLFASVVSNQTDIVTLYAQVASNVIAIAGNVLAAGTGIDITTNVISLTAASQASLLLADGAVQDNDTGLTLGGVFTSTGTLDGYEGLALREGVAEDLGYGWDGDNNTPRKTDIYAAIDTNGATANQGLFSLASTKYVEDAITARSSGGGGDWWTNAPDTALDFTTNVWTSGKSLQSTDGTNLYWTSPSASVTNLYLSDLADTMTSNAIPVGNGANLTLRTPAQTRTVLSLGSMAQANTDDYYTASQSGVLFATNAGTAGGGYYVQSNKAWTAFVPVAGISADTATQIAAVVVGEYTNRIDQALQPADTNDWETGSHAALMTTNGGRFAGPVYSDAQSAMDGPDNDEFGTAGWVRSMALGGAPWYLVDDETTNYPWGKTANMTLLHSSASSTPTTNIIASPVLSDTYLWGGVVTTKVSAVKSPINVELWMSRNGGNPATVMPLCVELYYVYNGTTNHLGDWPTAAQPLNVTDETPRRSRYTLAFVEPQLTGLADVLIYLKSGTVSGTAAGLNIHGDGIYPSLITLRGAGTEAADAVAADLASHETLALADGAHGGETDPLWDAWRTNAPSSTTNAIVDGELVSIGDLLGCDSWYASTVLTSAPTVTVTRAQGPELKLLVTNATCKLTFTLAGFPTNGASTVSISLNRQANTLGIDTNTIDAVTWNALPTIADSTWYRFVFTKGFGQTKFEVY